MKSSRTNRQRKSQRLKDYDYSQPNFYFITIVCRNKEALLSSRSTRRIVQSVWCSLSQRFQNVELDEYVIMPNHFHGIIFIKKSIKNIRRGGACPSHQNLAIIADDLQGAASSAPTELPQRCSSDSSLTLSDIVRAFKSVSAIRCNKVLGRTGRPFWQRGYYEHVIRNDIDLYEIRTYVRNNPSRYVLEKGSGKHS